MFEFHGWATLRDSPTDIDENTLNAAVATVESLIGGYPWRDGHSLLDLRWVNGVPHLTVTGFRNRKDTIVDDVFALFTHVARIAPGSYGEIHCHDDEDQRGFQNSFRVWVMARGNLTEHEDPFLSPFIPAVEDPSG